MSTISATDARSTLPDLLDRVEGGDEVVITRHGRPVAVLVRPDRLRGRRADEAMATADRVHELLVAARRAPLPAAGSLPEARADELVAEVRASRDRD